MSEGKKIEGEESAAKKSLSRRDFLIKGGTVAAVTGVAAVTPAIAAAATEPASDAKKTYPKSKGYIVYDSKKCTGCTTCMLSCSLTHYGVQSLSLARIQIMQDSFGKFPTDLKMAPCRQCVTPVCVENCPVGAAFIDTENGNVRRIDSKKCIGCKTCIKMCPQQPHRTVWNASLKKSSKCDLCIDTPYWNEKGGPGGKQACVDNCPMRALKFVTEAPNQQEEEGYDVNLRSDHWRKIGLLDGSEPIPEKAPAPAFGARPGAAGAPGAPRPAAPPTAPKGQQ